MKNFKEFINESSSNISEIEAYCLSEAIKCDKIITKLFDEHHNILTNDHELFGSFNRYTISKRANGFALVRHFSNIGSDTIFNFKQKDSKYIIKLNKNAMENGEFFIVDNWLKAIDFGIEYMLIKSKSNLTDQYDSQKCKNSLIKMLKDLKSKFNL